MNKYLAIGFWILVSVYLFVVLGFVGGRQKKSLCTSINVIVKDTLKYHFVEKDDLVKLIDPNEGKVLGKPMEDLNISMLEKIINNQPYIKSAQVFKSINGELNIEIIQRNPIIRIINENDLGFYIDNEGELLPLSKKISLRLPIANGYIQFQPDFDSSVNIFADEYKNDENAKILRDLSTLANFINNHEFWRAQIQQIFVNKEKEFELVPLVGAQIILLGKIDNYRDKFRNLEATYKKGFLYKGWNKYKKINLKYENQVICEKK